jgi:AraC-like DNA-binding protein
MTLRRGRVLRRGEKSANAWQKRAKPTKRGYCCFFSALKAHAHFFQNNFRRNFTAFSGRSAAPRSRLQLLSTREQAMEFIVQSLRAQAGNEPPGLRFGYAMKEVSAAFMGAGVLIVALRQPVELSIGEQRINIPKFGAYFVAAPDKAAERLTGPAQGQLQNQASLDSPMPMQAKSQGAWLMISASEITWRVLTEKMRRLGVANAQPYAGLWPESRTLAAWLLRTVREFRRQGLSTLEPLAIYQMAQAMQSALAGFHELVERCPGHNAPQKQQVFRRLMRVRQCMHLHCNDPINIQKLASMANYSRSHFMSVYRTVFGETPHRQLQERRLRHAQHMLKVIGLSVREATFAAGFEDRSSFSKLYRRYFGVTAQATRRAGVGCAFTLSPTPLP